MSTTLAIDLPDFDQQPATRLPRLSERHIEIVSTRDQRRKRPRVVYAAVAVGGLFGILIVQLLLSIWLSNGVYQISSLQQAQRELSRDQQSLTEALHVLQSPQNLASQAAVLGMVTNTGSQGFLSLNSGVLRNPTAASGDTTVAANIATLTPNSLITPGVLAAGPAGEPAGSGSTTLAPAPAAEPVQPVAAGAPSSTATAGSVTSTQSSSQPGAIPAPVTH